MKYKVENSKMPLLAKKRPSSGNNFNIQYFTTIRAHRLCPRKSHVVILQGVSKKVYPFKFKLTVIYCGNL
jgi:hypothetical protein